MSDAPTAPETPAAVPENPVLASRRRIAEAFAAHSASVPDRGTPAEACLAALLDSLGWSGAPRHVFEAMPHLGTVDDLASLRAVLLRLGIRTVALPGRACDLAGPAAPCLVLDERDGLSVVLRQEADGRLMVFQGRTRTTAAIEPSRLRGMVVRVKQPSADDEPGTTASQNWIADQIRAMRRPIARIGLLSLGINLLVPMTTLYVMTVYDKAIGTHSLDTLGYLLAGILGALAVEYFLRSKRASDLAHLGGRIDAAIAVNAFSRLLHLPVSMTENAGLGAQLNRFRQFEIGRELFQGRLAAALLDLPFTLIFFGLIFALGGSLGFIPVALAAVVGTFAAVTAPATAGRNRLAGEAKVKSDALSVEIATKLRAIREAGAEQIWLKRAEEAYARYVEHRYLANSATSALQTVSQASVSIAGAGLLGFGAWRVVEGHLSIGALVAIMAVAWRVLSPIQEVLLSIHRLGQLSATVRQINQLMRMKPEFDPTLLPNLKRSYSGRIQASGVGFRYPLRQDLTLKGLSLDVEPGSFVAITGPSGSGKSTLLRLLMGLHLPQAGSIRYDGLDIRQLELGDLRRTVGYLPQDSALFHGTVAQNIRLSAPDASDAEVAAVLDSLDLDVTANPMLPDGLATRVTAALREQLSLAMVQRLLLARVFVGNQPILLLDEPANHLDRSGDEAFQKMMLSRRAVSTVVLVTARPSHMRLCDKVVYMNEGTITASGTPAEMVPRILAATSRSA